MSHFAGRVGTVQSCITIGGRLVGLSLCAVSLGLSDASFGLIGVGLRLPCIGCILQGVGIGLGRIGLDLRINGVSLRGIGLSLSIFLLDLRLSRIGTRLMHIGAGLFAFDDGLGQGRRCGKSCNCGDCDKFHIALLDGNSPEGNRAKKERLQLFREKQRGTM